MYVDPQTRAELKAKLAAGQQVRCPCCDQNCRVYRRKLNAGMAAYLIDIVKEFEHLRAWVWVPGLTIYQSGYQRGDYSYLRHWKLIESKPNDTDPTTRNTGMWRPTLQGIAFANRRITAPKYIYLYNNRLLRYGGNQADVVEALADHFDYAELMQPNHVGPGSIFKQINAGVS